MKKMLKRGLSLVLAFIMVVGLLPVTAFAKVDNNTGYPQDLDNKLILSIYTTEGKFPGEPATHGSSEYVSFKSDFTRTSASGQFKASAESELSPSILEKNVLVEGTGNSSTKVWGVFSADGLNQYFLKDASIIQPENEKKIIKEIKKCSDKDADNYEIIWYVIKMQHSPSNWWWNSGTSEWHIDGVIKEKAKITINYYGNGNTSGSAPDGITNHTAGAAYTVLGKNTMVKKINGVEVSFLGWSAKADGTGAEAGFYQPGDVINPTQSISLYAMWDTTTQYTATVNTYLDGNLTDEDEIHGGERDLYLSTDEVHYYPLTKSAEGVYTTKITGNGKFHLYNKIDDTYNQVGDRQLTIYNQNGSMDVYHYSLTYKTDGGAFETNPAKAVYYYGDTATATANIPTKEGYRFLGWMYDGKLIQPGEDVTASVTGTMELTAQWEKTINVTVNVTIDHKGGDGYDQVATKDDVSLALVSRENDKSPYLELQGKTLQLSDSSHEGFEFEQEENKTTYTGYTYTDLPGGTTEYTVVTSKSGYDTTITPTQDQDGNWIIDVVMTYNPSNFDLDFTVEIADSVPAPYIPDAAIVKVTFWSTDRNQWEIITQQEGGAPGVRVDIDPTTRSGSGSYPVWKYESNGTTPYGYRIEVTSFVYPDGTIVPASNVVTQDVAWTDNVYTATVDPVTDGQKFGTLDGAYIGATDQVGTLNAVITMDLHDVTFNAQGGKVNGLDTQTVEDQYKIPSFKDYVPTREGGYTFGGWYLEADCTNAATEGEDLTKDITLYAKWIEPLTISGTVSVAGSYKQNNDTVPVNDIDRAMEAVVVLQELRDGHIYEVDSQTVKFQYGEDNNAATGYSFTGIPNQGKSYQIHVLELNYGTAYDNESDANSDFTANEYAAVFGGDNVADVDAHLTFVPPSYDQLMKVDATEISADFRPESVLAEVMYRDTGDIHPFKRISQHNVAPYGVQIGLTDGTGTGTQSIWKWHTDGMLYDYQMNISEVDGVAYDSETAPFYITYAAPAYWNGNTNAPSGELKATLIPKQYLITYDLNAGTDTVTGVDKLSYTNEDGTVVTTDIYGVIHTWSFDTPITAVPEREGYRFLGWEADVDDAYDGSKIAAAVHREVTLTAQWEKITYTVIATADPVEGGETTVSGTAKTEDGKYEHGSEVTVVATPNAGYTFDGWYEGETRVSAAQEYTFTVTSDRELTAKFEQNVYQVTANAEQGGTAEGTASYHYGETATVTANPNAGYTFIGWFENGKNVSEAAVYQFEVTGNRALTAKFEQNVYRVTANAEQGGTAEGTASYHYGETATVTATAEPGYRFVGWFENGVNASEDAKYEFEVTDNRKLTAMFEQNVYRVTANAEQGGTAVGTATYHYGDSATVTATVNATYTFDGWYEGTNKVSNELEYTFTVTSDRELTAKFTKNSYKVKTNHTEGGTTTGDGDYEEGASATVTAIPDEGYVFVGWFEDGTKVSEKAEYSFTVTAHRTLKAEFATAYTVTTIASPEGAGNLSGGGMYASGANVTITAQANGGYYFVGWYNEKNELVTAETSHTLTVMENRTFTAKFEQKVSYRCDYVYIFGYNDSQIGATGPLLRGELSQMIYRLVKQNKGVGNGGNSFSDTTGEWFESGISYMAKVGAIDRTKSNAYPYASVSCGETYKMICLGLGFTADTSLNYSDYAAILQNSGFPANGGVTSKIQRYQFCELFNAILGRSNYCTGPDGYKDTKGNVVTAETYGYTDLSPDDSYYRTMMIATSTFTGGKIDLDKRIERNTYDYTN